jgi:hypothetical protein
MPSSDSTLTRALAPLVGALGTLFGVWSILVALVWATGFGDVQLIENVANRDLRAALAAMLHALDAIWIALAAANVYLALAHSEGLGMARRWAGLVLAAAFLIAGASALTHWPLGPVLYSEHFGFRIGRVPATVALLWFTIILSARECALRALPRASHARIAWATAILSTLTDFNLEPLAWKWRAWWLWYPANLSAPALPPVQNSATWLLASFALALAMRATSVLPLVARRPIEPLVVFGAVNLVCLLTHAVLFLRR